MFSQRLILSGTSIWDIINCVSKHRSEVDAIISLEILFNYVCSISKDHSVLVTSGLPFGWKQVWSSESAITLFPPGRIFFVKPSFFALSVRNNWMRRFLSQSRYKETCFDTKVNWWFIWGPCSARNWCRTEQTRFSHQQMNGISQSLASLKLTRNCKIMHAHTHLTSAKVSDIQGVHLQRAKL